MARSRLTYAEAVRILTGGADPAAILGRLAGGALLLAAPFSGGVLALFDAKGEANALLRDLLGRAPARIRASRGKRHYDLIEAAHTILVISSFFDAFGELADPLLADLELTDEERRTIAGARPHLPVPPMPGALQGLSETLSKLHATFDVMYASLRSFAHHLAAGQGRTYPGGRATIERALGRRACHL